MPGSRDIFCNRTLNIRSIRAIGYDMDYTLVHYHVVEWERRAYEVLKEKLLVLGWPVQGLQFEPERVCRGLIIDTEKGNLVKANRFGYIKKVYHGTHEVPHEVQRDMYSRTIVDLSKPRWIFLNTLFSISEGCMYAQLVDLLDQRKIPDVLGYSNLYDRTKSLLDSAHMEGKLKSDIMNDPDRFVIRDPDLLLTLQDQRAAGKKLLLITNSEPNYTEFMMNYILGPELKPGESWKDLFDVVVVSARKPTFFSSKQPFYEVVSSDGLLRSHIGRLERGKIYSGGSAQDIERYLGVSGDEILYVGDHMFGDVLVSKNILRWRTALVLRELEDEILAVSAFAAHEKSLQQKMHLKEKLETELSQLRVGILRLREGYGPDLGLPLDDLEKQFDAKRELLVQLDQEIGPIAQESAKLNNPYWGLLLRTGNDKSHLAYQLERYADIYTSRVTNFLKATPFVFLRSPKGSLPHDPVEP